MVALHLEEALDQGKARLAAYDALRFARYTDDFKGIPRGTVVFDDGPTVFGYPHIGRVLALGQGLVEQFAAPVWMEEKIDGYNVRAFRVGDRVLALTRGGFVCPFTTDRLPELMDIGVFGAEPDLVVCAEVAGPENPYLEASPPWIEEDVALFVFDLMRQGRPGFIPHARRAALVQRHALPSVQVFGRYRLDELEAIREVLVRANDEGREGVVFKEDSQRDRRAKYVTSNSNITDIQVTALNILELPAEYFTNRILRLVLFLEEQGLERSRELDERLGAAFLEGLLGAVAQYREEKKVFRTYRCRFRDRDNAQRLMTQLQQITARQVNVSRRSLKRQGSHWVLEFDRVYPSMCGVLGHLLGGGLVFD